MSIIRNLTISDIVLDDLGGITIQASSDYDLKEETQNDIANSNTLNNNISSGNIVFVDNQGNQLTLQESLDTQNAVSAVFPAVSLKKANTNIPGTPFSTINFKNNITPAVGSPIDGISIMPTNNLSKTIIGGQEMLTYSDPTRANKILSVEKLIYFNYAIQVNIGTFLAISTIGSLSASGFVMPFDATIVGFAAITLSTNNKAATFAPVIDDVQDTNLTISIPATPSMVSVWDNTIDFDINAGQKIAIQNVTLQGGGTQNGVSIMLYIRWRG